MAATATTIDDTQELPLRDVGSMPALVPRTRTSKLSIKSRASIESPATLSTPQTPPNSDERPSAIDEVTPSFNRNLSKLLSTTRRQKVEVESLRGQVEKLAEENLALDREAAALRNRVNSLEQEHADLRSEARESDRARRRAEHRLSSLSARGASPPPDRPTTPTHQAHAPQPLNNELAAATAAGHARSVSWNDPSTSASTSTPTRSSLPSRSTTSPYREYQALQQNGLPRRTASASRARASARFSSDGSTSASTSASPRSHGAELPPLASPLASSPASVNSPLPETPLSEAESSTPFGSISGLALDRSSSMSGSMRKRISALIGGIAGSGGKKRPALDISTPHRPVDARVQMLTSATTPTLRDAVAAAGSSSKRTGSPSGDLTPSRGSSNASSQRKATPGSSVSKASGNGRPAWGDPSDSGRRGISRPMDTSASSASSHHSMAPRTSVDAHGVLDKRGSVEAVRRSQLSNRGRGFEHGAFAFEKPMTRVAPPLGSSLTPSRQPLKQGSTDTGTSVARTIEESVNEGRYGSTGSRGQRVSFEEGRSRADSGGRSVSEKPDKSALNRAASLGNANRNVKERVLDEKKRSGSMREKREPVREEHRREKTGTSSLGRLFLQKTREVFCAGRAPSQMSHISPPITPMVVQARRSPTAPSSPTTITPAVSTSVQPAHSGPALPPRKRKPLPISTQLPLFAFEPASSAGRSTPDSARSRGSANRDREVTFKMPGGQLHTRDRVAALSSRSPKSDVQTMPENQYEHFCVELRRVVGDDAFVVFEKYVRQYEDQIFPLLGPRGLVERLKKILDLSHAGEERKRALVDRFLHIAREAEADR